MEVTIRLSEQEAQILAAMMTEVKKQMQESMTVAEMLANPEYSTIFTVMKKVLVQCPKM